MNDPRELPDYSWAGDDPGVMGAPSPSAQVAIPELITETESNPFPLVTDSASGRDEPLINIEDPQILTISAYWHTDWPWSYPETQLRKSAAARLSEAALSLPTGFGLAVWDAWRDPRLQKSLHTVAYRDLNLAPGFVSLPSEDPARPAPHSTGGTVDVTLTWKDRPLALGTDFDEFIDRARSRALEAVDDADPSALARDLRRMLRTAMTGAGFVQLDCEWWHFEYGTRLWAAVHNTSPIYPAAQVPGR